MTQQKLTDTTLDDLNEATAERDDALKDISELRESLKRERERYKRAQAQVEEIERDLRKGQGRL